MENEAPVETLGVYRESIERGRRLYHLLNMFQWAEEPARSLRDCYVVNTRPFRLPRQTVKLLESEQIEANGYIYVDVKRLGPRGGDDAIYSNWFHGSEGVIICHENDKRRDSDPPKLWSSEAMWQLFLVATANDQTSPSRLRNIVRHGVINAAIRMVTWQAAREPATSLTRADGYRVYWPADEGFYALLGSVNGLNTMRMLLEHKGKIGYRTVMKVVVFGSEDVNDFREQRTFIIVLSNEREPRELLQPPAADKSPIE